MLLAPFRPALSRWSRPSVTRLISFQGRTSPVPLTTSKALTIYKSRVPRVPVTRLQTIVTAGPNAPVQPTLGTFMRLLPKPAVPYAQLIRLDKPVGTWLLYWPCTWGIGMAAYASSAPIMSTLWTLTLFGIGALVMRGAGCIVNDLWDRNLDKQVERTASRPIASGLITPKQGMVYLFGQLLVGLGVLLSLPLDCFLLGASSLGFVATYPLFKRFTYYPQLMLAFTYNWGAMLGFPAMHVWDMSTMASLYLSGVCWTMVYDTIYAHQDKRDDVSAGIKSTALAWADKSKLIMTGFTVAQAGLLVTAGALNAMGPLYFAGVAWAMYRLGKMIYQVDLETPKNCWKWFVDNIKTGGVIFLGIFLDYLSNLFTIFM
ncbi:UbiA prenyltransferase family-domain-containing protein [Lipomyces oligophaga]|uniref:UbiA prenyltransferase family-domain-containing protein n=1 Tax=Lipomyces oligophaga TaxID=45792 RepID=UPI0034CFBF4A